MLPPSTRGLWKLHVYIFGNMCTCWKVGTHTCVHVSYVKRKVYRKWLVKHHCHKWTAVLKMQRILKQSFIKIYCFKQLQTTPFPCLSMSSLFGTLILTNNWGFRTNILNISSDTNFPYVTSAGKSKDIPTKQSFTIIYFITFRKTIHVEIICRNVHSWRQYFPNTWAQFIKPKIET